MFPESIPGRAPVEFGDLIWVRDLPQHFCRHKKNIRRYRPEQVEAVHAQEIDQNARIRRNVHLVGQQRLRLRVIFRLKRRNEGVELLRRDISQLGYFAQF